MIVMTG